ncbi:MAG TPA: amino acid adenylation domain-containing protein [Ktedonobacteraceae bacterium]
MQSASVKGARLSQQQERIWHFQQVQACPRLQCALGIDGRLHLQFFCTALQQVIARHEILRTRFVRVPGLDLPVQVRGHALSVSCPLLDLRNLTPSAREAALAACFAQAQDVPIDQAGASLLSPLLLRTGGQEHILLLGASPLCADQHSLLLLAQHLATRYLALLHGQCIQEEAPVQYVALAAWQKGLREAEGAEQALDLWRQIDLSRLAPTRLPFAGLALFAPEQSQERQGLCERPVPLPSGVAAHLERLDPPALEGLLLGSWAALLSRFSEQEELLLGVQVDGRPFEELAGALGPLARCVPLRLHLPAGQPCTQLLAALPAHLERLRAWQAYFSWPAADAAQVFPLSFSLQRWPQPLTSGYRLLRLGGWGEALGLHLGVLVVGQRLALTLCCQGSLLSADQLALLADALVAVLECMLARPQTPLAALPLLTAHQRQRVLGELRGRSYPLPAHPLLFAWQACVEHRPDALALVTMQQQYTYASLHALAWRLAARLQRAGAAPNRLVALCLPRSARLLVGLLAVLISGAAFLPLDPEQPSARLLGLLGASGATLVLAESALLAVVSQQEQAWLALDHELAAWQGEEVRAVEVQPADLAYQVYTSGSTGEPKGVMITHGALLNYIRAILGQLRPPPGWHYGWVSPLAADLGYTSLFACLLAGGCLHLVERETSGDGRAWQGWLRAWPIDVLKIVPSHLEALLAAGEQENWQESLPMRALLLGGEVAGQSLLKRLEERPATCRLFNHYGPTETTVGVLLHACVPGERLSRGLPLGRALGNTQVLVLDAAGQPLPAGVVGEICIAGAGLGWGYAGAGHLTAQHFVPHVAARRPGERMYRSGDRGYITQEGEVVYVGRCDWQVKVRGYRVELGEIEATLGRHPQLRRCALLLREDAPAAGLLAFVVARHLAALPQERELREWLAERLPTYMLPASFVFLKSLPLNASGKIDRAGLLALAGSDLLASPLVVHTPDACGQGMLPRDMVEMGLLHIWEELLPGRTIGIMENFFDLGGHSLLAVRLISQIHQHFGQDLVLTTFLHHPTIAELALVLRRQPLAPTSPLVPLQRAGSQTPFFCVHPSGGTVSSYIPLARQLGTQRPCYGLQTTGMESAQNSTASIQELARQYLQAIQAVQPHGPYLLGGWSMGGTVAFEMARQLSEQGESIGLLALIDSRLATARLRSWAQQADPVLEDEEFARMLAVNLNLTLPELCAAMEPAAKLACVFALAKRENGIPADFALEQVRQVFQTIKQHNRLAYLYLPAPCPLHIDYFVAQASLPQEPQEGVPVGSSAVIEAWRAIAQAGLTIHPVAGNHRAIMQEPGVQALAHALRACLAQQSLPARP